ncbi:GH3 auxin-responsive promoter [Pisolithus orientalis]|uniref:GH3 auxin-responsive promoter n=1 Tax=Pisolithus orientalis TaxID=936130 RepID=UPI002225B114|nr:GH3 auxin-responsive promoter [Pisolithus orientalis]KAI6007578.1 GH3 auxin-responsive promoter [Pisolithus orientalis]
MSPSQVPQPIHVLSPDLVGVLKNSVEATLVALIKKNKHTRYFSESPVFASFHSAIRNLGRGDYGGISDDIFLETYRTTIPLTTYSSYEPFVAKFLAETCQEDDIRDMFSPGLPHHIATTSSTSSPKPKFFCKYKHDQGSPYAYGDGRTTFWTFSLHYRQLVKIQNRNGDIIKTIPAGLESSGGARMRHGLTVENDHLNMKLAGEWATSPPAVGFIRDHRTFLLTHTLFALADSKVETISIIFITSAVDMIRYMEEEWETLIASIETGELPAWDEIKDVREHLQPHFPPRPERAAQLRTVGKATDQPGWLLKIWPMLKTTLSVSSGVFSVGVPKLRFYLGPDVQLRSVGFACSEVYIASVYDPSDLNLFKVTSQDIIEYLDVVKEENASSIVPPWLVEVGKHYEVVATTRDGMWRYRSGDVVKIAGFDPTDGLPIIRYFERRNVITWMAGGALTEKHIATAILAVQDTLAPIVEFTAIIDSCSGIPTLGYLVEVHGELHPEAAKAPVKLRNELCRLNEEFDPQRMQIPTIRVLEPGTFGEYRHWRTGVTNSGSGQTKVPVLIWDNTAREWMLARVRRELGVNSNGRALQG